MNETNETRLIGDTPRDQSQNLRDLRGCCETGSQRIHQNVPKTTSEIRGRDGSEAAQASAHITSSPGPVCFPEVEGDVGGKR